VQEKRREADNPASPQKTVLHGSRGFVASKASVLTRLAPDRAIGSDFNGSTRILVRFVAKVLTPHPPGK